MKKAYEIHRWNIWSFSCVTPVRSVIQFVLLAVALWTVSSFHGNEWRTYKTKGMHAKAIHPDLVPRGGELPQSKLGQ